MKTIGILGADVADIYLANAVSYLERNYEEDFKQFSAVPVIPMRQKKRWR